MASTAKAFKVSTPQILWQGGGTDHGKPDPVFSVDVHPVENVFLTTGVDHSVPPKGSVRIWKLNVEEEGNVECFVDLCDHQSVVNIARFSPCGKILASASEKQILVYTLPANTKWEDVREIRQLSRTFLCPTLSEIYDLDWSPDSTHLVIGALDGKAEIIRINQRDSHIIPGHTAYVQGVSWDPQNKLIATFSCDRSCKIHQLKVKEGHTTKLAPRGHATIKMHHGFTQSMEFKATEEKSLEQQQQQQMEQVVKGINLFADSTVPSFFRRLSFSPDGALLVVPTGIHRPLTTTPATAMKPIQQKIAGSQQQQQLQTQSALSTRSYATHIFLRDQWQTPCLSLVGLEEPSVAVRFCPRLFSLVEYPTSSGVSSVPLFAADYRLLYAVVTVSSVLIYDTQHAQPLMKLSGQHLAAINDAAWTPDGRVLVVCSSDGYLTFVRFQPGALGQPLPDAEVLESVRRSFPAVYNCTAPVAAAPALVSAPTPVVPSAAVVEESPALVVAEPVADAEVSGKKRKRIQPIQVLPATAMQVPVPVEQPAELGSDSVAVHVVEPVEQVAMEIESV